MANYTDRLLLVVDAATKAAQNQLGQLQSSLSKTDSAAETSTKKAGLLASGWDKVQSSGLLAGASVAGAAKLIMDSVGDWTRLGKAVTDASDALGISAEEASRWIAVADDYEVSASTITGALLRVERAAAGPATPLKELGIAVKKASDGSTDLTGTAGNIADGLNKIEDPAARAAAGVKIFGKGWATVAPVFAHTSDELNTMLASVSDAQTVTDAEAESAEELRLAQDRLNDSLADFKLALGQTVAAFAPVLDVFAQGVEWAGKLNDAVSDSSKPWTVLTDAFKSVANPVGSIVEQFGELKDRLTGTEPKAKDTVKTVAELGEAAETTATKTDVLADAYKTLKDELDFEETALDVADAFDDVAAAAKASWDAAAQGAADADAKARDYERSIIKSKDKALEFIQAIGNVPPSKTTEILTLIDQGNYQAAQRALDELGKPVYSTVVIAGVTLQKNVKYIPGVGYVPASAAAQGAAVTRQGALGAPVPAPAASMPTVAAPVVVNVQGAVIGDPGAVAQAVTAALTRYQRLNGPRSVLLTKGGVP